MKELIDIAINNIVHDESPATASLDVSILLSKLIKNNMISLYEVYLINMEILRLNRLAYTQKSWGRNVSITNIISIINQLMIANIFEDSKAVEILQVWALEAYSLNKEKREHYIIDNYKGYIECSSNRKLLEKLSDFRKYANELPFNDGPYHFEVVPDMYYSPEDILLNSELLQEVRKNKNIQEAIEDFIVELNIRF